MKIRFLILLIFLSSITVLRAKTWYENDFEGDPVGQQPAGFTYSPPSNTGTNGAVVIDAASTPANPLSGQSLYLYDLSGDLSSGEPTHVRKSFNGGQNVSNVRVDFDFQRGYASVSADDTDTRVHFAVARAGDRLNNSDFRPFEIRILNSGILVVNSIAGSVAVGPYLIDAPNHLSVLINSHDTNSVDYDDSELGTGILAPNTFHVFLNNSPVGEYTFHQTPDPTNAPQIDFYAENNDLGQFAFYQDSKRQGGLVIDNLVIRALKAGITELAAPTGLSAVADTAVRVSLGWTDNAAGEDAYVVERKSGPDDFVVMAELDANTEGFVDGSVLPEIAYTYRVKAITTSVESAPSNEAEAITPEQIEPLIVGTEVPDLVVSGRVARVSVFSLGRAPLATQWYLGRGGDTSNPVEGATTPTLTLTVGGEDLQVWVRVSNASGSSDSETVVIQVHTPVSTIVVNESQLEAAIASVGPGDVILLQDGKWEDLVIDLRGEGTADDLITLGAETPGAVILTGESRVEMGGSWLVLRDLVFEGPYAGNDDEVIQLRSNAPRAHNCRVTNISMIDYVPENGARTVWVSLYGTRNRVDHSYFKGHNVRGVTLVVWLDGNPNDHRIDHNHFADRGSGGGANGWETIRIGTSDNSMSESRTTVDHNLFTRVDGEIEIISNKSGGNVYRCNTFEECQGTLSLRHGNGCTVESNTFIGRGRSGTGGIRVMGEGHLIINNYFYGTMARDGAAITVYAGVPDSPLNGYFAAHGATIAFNSFMDNLGALIEVGAGFGERDRTELPRGITVANNLMARTSPAIPPYVIGENPADQTWKTNLIHHGAAGIEVEGGFVTGDPEISFDLIRQLDIPGSDGAVADAATPGVPALGVDMEGLGRGAAPDIGAHEVTSHEAPGQIGPVTTIDTGPSYLGPQRDRNVPNLRLVNNSTRGISDRGEGLIINGFVIGDDGPKSVLVRAIGPGLVLYGITAPMPEPVLRLFDGDGREIAMNRGWQNGPEADLIEASRLAGAFPLRDGSLDSALLTGLSAGLYTAQVTPADGMVGTVLVEVYDLTQGRGTTTNQSSRGSVGSGQEVLITGFVVEGTAARKVLVRGAGPALNDLGVTTAIVNPTLGVFDRDSEKVAENDNWSDSSNATEIKMTAGEVGAFPFADGSSDAALLLTLEPGPYTVRLSGVDGETGTTLVEVYLVD